MAESDSKIALASLNFVIGIGCVSTVLINLSIVPDCGSNMSSQFLTYLVVQSSVNLVALMTTTLSMSFLLAVDDDEFMSDSMNDFPGHVLIFGIYVTTFIQFCSSFNRFLSIIAPILTIRIFSKAFVFTTIMGSFLLAANKFVNNLVQKRTLNFSIKNYLWLRSLPEDEKLLQITVIAAGITLTFLCILSIIRIFLDNCVFIADRRYLDKLEIAKEIGSTFLFLIGDLIYCFLLLFASHTSQPGDPIQRQLSGFRVILGVLQGYTQCFLVLTWPVICSIIHYDQVRNVIKMRIKLMFDQDQLVTARRRRPSSKKISVVASASPISTMYDVEKAVLHKKSTSDEFE